MYKNHKIHFVGIGGVGMSGIAEVLLNLGYPVSGSDLKRSNTTTRLSKKGATITYGHRKGVIRDAEVVVVSSAVKENNPEVLEAREKNIPIIQRAEMLAELMRLSRYGIAIAGTHGKTTTTSLIASVLYQGGRDPTMVIGGKVKSFRSNARLGSGDFLVAEADESDGSFLKLSPSISVITSIDPEHMEHYGSFSKVKEAYLQFVQRLPFYGLAICCADHPVIQSLLPQMKKRVMTYGFAQDAHVRADRLIPDGEKVHFDLYVDGASKGQCTLNMPGQHNVQNALASIAVGLELGISLKQIFKALRIFKGIERRCEVLLKNSAVCVIDDYGHHPEEIKATLSTIRGSFAGRLVTLFQPHRYSRTKALYSQFLGAFNKANVLLLTDIYAAGEKVLPGVSSKKLAADLKKKKNVDVSYIPKNSKIVEQVIQNIQPGDVLLTLGAGDVTKIGRECAKKLKHFG